MKPGPGDSDFEQWQSAMKMVARLPDGVPHEFRNTVRTQRARKYIYIKVYRYPWSILNEKRITVYGRTFAYPAAGRICFFPPVND